MKSNLMEIEDAIDFISKATNTKNGDVRAIVFEICKNKTIKLIDRFGQQMKWFPDIFKYENDDENNIVSFRRGFRIDITELYDVIRSK